MMTAITRLSPMDIRFGCDSCDQHIEADASLRGTAVPCPRCGRRLIVPAGSTVPPRPVPPPRDFVFECWSCHQSLVVDERGIGLKVKCPRCRKEILVPNPNAAAYTWTAPAPAPPTPLGSRSPAPAPSPGRPGTRQCPYCAETIKQEAIVCRFCGRDLERVPTRLQLHGLGQPAAGAAGAPAAPPPRRRRAILRHLVQLVVLSVVAYLAWPFAGVSALQRALAGADAAALREAVDFAAVRPVLAEQIGPATWETWATTAYETGALNEDFGTALATIIGPGPDEAAPAAQDPRPLALRWGEIDYAFFVSPAEFLVKTHGTKLRFRLQGFRWRVTRIELPR